MFPNGFRRLHSLSLGDHFHNGLAVDFEIFLNFWLQRFSILFALNCPTHLYQTNANDTCNGKSCSWLLFQMQNNCNVMNVQWDSTNTVKVSKILHSLSMFLGTTANDLKKKTGCRCQSKLFIYLFIFLESKSNDGILFHVSQSTDCLAIEKLFHRISHSKVDQIKLIFWKKNKGVKLSYVVSVLGF